MSTDPRPTTRRDLLRALGFGAGALAMGGPALLAGCGDGGNGSAEPGGGTASTSPTTSSTVAPTTFDLSRPYWVQGNFAPATVEETVTDLEVVGTLPPELSGLYLRNGPNSQTPDPAHWFLGDGMLHGVRLREGRALWYRNRYVQTPLAVAKKDLFNFGGVPGRENNQSNVAVIHHAGRLLATGEVGWPYQIDPSDLSTVAAWDFGGALGTTMTAHPKIDPATGRMHFFGYDILSPRITYYSTTAEGAVQTATDIPLDVITMVHDFAITDRDVVFWIGPVVFGSNPENMYPDVPFTWDRSAPCRLGVMPLDGSADQMRWVDIPPCFVFHGMNAHRDGDDVVLRVHRMDEAFGAKGDLVDPILTEWRIGTAGPELTFTERTVFERTMDLPTHDRRLTGRASRHGWCVTGVDVEPTPDDAPDLGGIVHVDLRDETEDRWLPGQAKAAAEAFFVPADRTKDATSDEGEGWLLSYIWDRATDRSSLGVFEALDVAKGPVAEVRLPVRVPFGFHGCWVDESLI
jgi:carotenoid cleavage dioxygenase-like enzyme